MTENYTPPAVWQRWADEGGTMAILTVQESADMLKRMAERVIDDNRSQPLYPSYARAILDVLAALENAQKQLAAVPVEEIRHHRAGAHFGYVYGQPTDWSAVSATNEAIDEWLKTQPEVTP